MLESRIPECIRDTVLVCLLPEPMRRKFVDLILSVAKRTEIAPGQVLFTLGETDTDRGFLFLEGALKITRSDGTVRYQESPDILGEVQLFTPQARRSATVEVVYGGTALTFAWHELGAAAKEAFNADELAELRKAIQRSATMREQNMLTSLDE